MEVVIPQLGVLPRLHLFHRCPQRGAVGQRHTVVGNDSRRLLGKRRLVLGALQHLLRHPLGGKDLPRSLFSAACRQQQHCRQQNQSSFLHTVSSVDLPSSPRRCSGLSCRYSCRSRHGHSKEFIPSFIISVSLRQVKHTHSVFHRCAAGRRSVGLAQIPAATGFFNLHAKLGSSFCGFPDLLGYHALVTAKQRSACFRSTGRCYCLCPL